MAPQWSSSKVIVASIIAVSHSDADLLAKKFPRENVNLKYWYEIFLERI